MNKETAQQTLKHLQESIAAATKQAQELQDIIDKPDVPLVFQGVLLDQVHARTLSGKATVYSDGDVDINASPTVGRLTQGQLFIDESRCIQEREYRKVRHLARIAMAKDWGDDNTLTTSPLQMRYSVVLVDGKPKVCSYSSTWAPICFKTKATAEAFLHDVGAEKVTLLLTNM